MDYRDVYWSRINHLGETTAEIIKNGGIRSFERWYEQSPFTVRDLSVERGLYFGGIIEEKKDEKQLKTMYMHVANDIPVKVGDILNWRTEDGSVEKWILLQEERKVNGTYRTFWIIRCNYLIKWVTNSGSVQQSWAYVVSSQDDKIKGNFRTWHNLITPQPNKYAEIVMPKVNINRGTNFIIEGESWSLIELDHTSVPGIIYLSLTESKVNMINDDLINELADTDKIKFPELDSYYTVGDRVLPHFVDDTFDIVNITMTSSNTDVINNDMEVVGAGTTIITVALKDNPTTSKTYEIIVRENSNFTAYIDGPETLRLDRQASYTLVGTEPINGEVTFDIGNTQLVNVVPQYDINGVLIPNLCVLHANNKNKLDSIVLSATYNGITYTKTIRIIPLW